MPDPATVIAERFLPKASEATVAGTTIRSGDAAVSGTYHSSRRTEPSFTRLSDLVSQRIAKIDSAGNVRLLFAIWPFGDGETFKRVERNLHEGPGSARIAFVQDVGSESYIASNITASSTRGQRVPWSLDFALDRTGAHREHRGRSADAAGLASRRAVGLAAQEAMERGPPRGAQLCRGEAGLAG